MSGISIGVETNCVRDIKDTIQIAKSNSQDFIVVPLFHPRNRRNIANRVNEGLLTRSDMTLGSKDWTSHVVGKISPWIDLDNSCVTIRTTSEKTLIQEFAWASHLGLQAVIFPTLTISCPNYARCVQQLCSTTCHQHIWIRVPLVLSLDYHSVGTSLQNVTDGWEAWNRFRFLCCHNPQVAVAIELTEDLPDTLEMMNRWTGEPVRAVIIPTYVFLTNKKDFPVLSSRHQDALRILMTHKVHIILKGRPTHCGGESMTPYVEYIQHIYARLQQARGSQNNLYASYRDYLQAPLQPLMDNLESQVYETFEQDPVKYRLYELAITKALLSIKEGKKSNIRNGFNSDECDIDDAAVNGEDEMMVNAESDLVYVMVVGAGRGPLVACTLSAAAATSTMVHIYAVEKNKNAVITLRNRCKQESWTNVDIVNCDMRHWSPPQKADLMVSELLGSWGDNELSPECLDGAQVGLKDSGISIPHSYTSFLAPISASKLWNSARSQPGGKGLDIPYVVKLHSSYQCGAAQPLFDFVHPNRDNPIDNNRYKSLSFFVDTPTIIHGFAGTFESVLYDDVVMSIRPETHSSGMFSWFPLFIPLVDPINVKAGETIVVHVWRCVDDKKVWYEWCVTSPITSRIQNSKGASNWIGL